MIATHSGAYHWDDCLAVYMLRALPRYSNHKVVRTRIPDEIEQAEVVVDVGDAYNPARGRFDHHMLGFDVVFDEGYYDSPPSYRSQRRVVCSSAGLVYKHFGREIIQALLHSLRSSDAISEAEAERAKKQENRDWLVRTVYYDYLQVVDANDNGISLVDASCDAPGASVSVKAVATDRSSMASRIHRHQAEAAILQDAAETDNYLESFLAASRLAGEELLEFVRFTAKYSLESWARGCEAFRARRDFHPSGRALYVPGKGFDRTMVFELESHFQVPEEESILYVATESCSGYVITAVSASPASFTSRRPYPRAWWGLRDAALSAASEVPDMIFCHKNGFTGGMRTREAMAAALDKMLAGFTEAVRESPQKSS